MEKGVYVKDINPNCPINDCLFEVREAISGLTKRGDPFWRLRLCDASGSITAVIWSPASTEINQLEDGVIVRISGNVSTYNGGLQIVVRKIAKLAGEEISLLEPGAFREVSEHDGDALFSALCDAANQEFIYDGWRGLVFSILSDEALMFKFKKARAAKNMHHAYEGGLLEHSFSVFQLCAHIADHYGDFLDRQTLLAAALFHDIGKTREFSLNLGEDYTDIGRLQGHIFLGLEILDPYLKQSGLDPLLTDHFKHLILSHHGQLEFGSPCVPQTPEAFVLHYADDLDAKLARCKSVFRNMDPDTGRWSEWQRTMDRFLYMSAHTSDFS